MPHGRRLGVDLGDARIGIAASDPSGLLATPVETVPAGEESVARIVALAREHDVIEIVVGRPRSLSGRDGPAAKKVRAVAAELATAAHPTPVRLVDERLSTVQADQALRTSSRKGAAKRAVIDQVAATVILQTALDTERTSGRAPGDLV